MDRGGEAAGVESTDLACASASVRVCCDKRVSGNLSVSLVTSDSNNQKREQRRAWLVGRLVLYLARYGSAQLLQQRGRLLAVAIIASRAA